MLAAAEEGHEDIVRLMLFRGANIYNVVLTIATRREYESLARLTMVDQGANNYN